jgi:hypothetical protein
MDRRRNAKDQRELFAGLSGEIAGTAMKTWVDLYTQHQSLRKGAHRNAVDAIRGELRRFAELRFSVLPEQIQSRFQPADNQQTGLKTYKLGLGQASGEELILPRHPGYQNGLIHLEEARLTILLLVNTESDHLHEMTVMLEGKRADDTPVTIAVHLPDDRVTKKRPHGDRQGHGACGHAALHCHIGPTLDVPPELRVPMPALTPGEVVAWVLSQVVPTPDFEPAPWEDVLGALKPLGP